MRSNQKQGPNKEDAERYAVKKYYKRLDSFQIMLILSRKVNETIVIDGCILVRVVRVDGEVVKLGIQAPKDIPVHRLEVYEEIQRENQDALTKGRPPVPKITNEKQDPHGGLSSAPRKTRK